MASGDTLLPSQHNPAMQDIAQALSNSLDRNGYGGMRAPLNMGGFPAQNAVAGTAPNDLATVGQLGAYGVPVGTVLDYAGTVAPTGYLFCVGQTLSRSDYADLFAAIGTFYGAGNGSTTFNIPDCRGRVIAGQDNMNGTPANRLTTFGATSVGAAGGSDRVALNISQMPSHAHGGNTGQAGAHSHNVDAFLASTGGAQSGSRVEPGTRGSGVETSLVGDHTHVIAAEGGGEGHDNVQPTIIMAKIIKVTV